MGRFLVGPFWARAATSLPYDAADFPLTRSFPLTKYMPSFAAPAPAEEDPIHHKSRFSVIIRSYILCLDA
jgi:hypothetical protein